MTGRRLAIVSDYAGLVDALRARSDELRMTRKGLDRVAGLPDGYCGKLLSEVPIRHLSHTSLGPVLGALGVMLVLVEDLSIVKRITVELSKAYTRKSIPAIEKRRKPRKFATFKRSPTLAKLARAKQIANQSDKTRSRMARHAVQVRWKRYRDSISGSRIPDKAAATLPQVRE